MTQLHMPVRVVKKRREAEGICSFELASVSGVPLPAFTAGAHIDVHVQGLVRQYSLCNTSESTGSYRIAVLREPESRGGSAALHEWVDENQTLSISEPRNHFALEPEAPHSLLLAGGIGITPILSMAQTLCNGGASFEMHYCARSPSRAAFLHYIESSTFSGQAYFHFDDGLAGQRLDLARVIGHAAEGTHLYACGPAGFLESVLATARAVGWPEYRIHREYFAAPNSESERKRMRPTVSS